MSTINAAYANQRHGDYPPDTCVVAEAPLSSMGDPVELVAGTKLVRFCCESCFPRFRNYLAAYPSKLPQG